MELEDLAKHTASEEVDPIKVEYGGVTVYEIPPNGQGITALIALQILNGIDLDGLDHNSAEYLHLLIESLRLAFADAAKYGGVSHAQHSADAV